MVRFSLMIEKAWNKFYVTRIAPLREKSFPIESPDVIHYLYFPKKKSKALVVILQAFHPEGTRYNYVSTLQGINASRLYIKDDFTPNTGSFYLGRNGTYNIEAGVHRLIQQTAEQCHAEKLIFVGSSKGGAAAVNFGISYPGAAMIVAAPMYHMGTYMFETKKFNKALEDAVGAPVTPEKISELDDRTPAKVRSDSFGNTQRAYIHISVNDKTYQKHVLDMIADMERAGIQIILDKDDYEGHENLKYYFPDFLKQSMAKELAQE